MTQLVTHLSSQEPASREAGRLSTEKGLSPVSLPPLLSQELHSRVNHCIWQGKGAPVDMLTAHQSGKPTASTMLTGHPPSTTKQNKVLKDDQRPEWVA